MAKPKLTKKKNSWQIRGALAKPISTGSKPPPVEFGEYRLIELGVTKALSLSMPKQSDFAFPIGDWTKGKSEGCPLQRHLESMGHKNPVDSLQKVYRDAINKFRCVSTDESLLRQMMESDDSARCFVAGNQQDLLDSVLSWTNLNQDNALSEYWVKTGASASFDFALKGVPADLKAHDIRVPSRFLHTDGRVKSQREALCTFIDKCTYEFAQGWGAVLTMYLMSLGLPILVVLTNGEHLCVVNMTKWYQNTSSHRDNRRRTFYWNKWVAQTLNLYGLSDVAESLGENSGERAGFTYRNTRYDKDMSTTSHSCLPRVGDGKSNAPRLRVSVKDFTTPTGRPIYSNGAISRNALDKLIAPSVCSPLMRVEDLAGWLPNLNKIL